MILERPIAMSIAGFDPSGGAGILADIKTFEQLNVQGFGVLTANTIQNDREVKDVKWMPIEDILGQLDVLLESFEVNYFKIGIVENSDVFTELKKRIIKHNRQAKIIWDPVLESSSGFTFFNNNLPIKELLKHVYLITPNLPEFEKLFANEREALEYSKNCNIYLKGGHHETEKGIDYLYSGATKTLFSSGEQDVYPKHGSGCVLSSAITAYLAKQEDLEISCEMAKTYTENYLSSSPSLLGQHS